jgi:outer membrane protein
MKWNLLLIGVFCVSVARGQQSQQLSIEEAIRIGKENSKVLRIAAAKVDGAAAKSGEANAVLLPSLKLEGSYKRQSDIDPFVLKVPSLIATPIEIMPNIPNAYALRVGVQQPLFTGFRLSSNAAVAENLTRAAEADRKGSESELVVNIISSYWMLYQANEAKRFVDENVDRISSYVADTENLMRAGLATRNDLLKIQVQLSTARLAQIDATNDVDVAMMTLNNVLGLPLETQIQQTSVPDMTMSQEGGSVQTSASSPTPILVDMAMKNRADLSGMSARVDASQEGVRAAQGGWWPQIGFFANYFYNRPNQRLFPLQDKFKDTWEVGVALQFDVWNWGIAGHQSAQARSVLQQNELALLQMKDNAALEVKRTQLGVVRASKRIEVARAAIDQADENSRSINEKYKNGLATSTELLDASVALLQARTSFTGALVEHQIALARLNRAVGF